MDKNRCTITSDYHSLTREAVVKLLEQRDAELENKDAEQERKPVAFLNLSAWYLAGAARNAFQKGYDLCLLCS
ncbi:hypothetical protein ABVC73_04375 [Prevotella melaninogenica]